MSDIVKKRKKIRKLYMIHITKFNAFLLQCENYIKTLFSQDVL